MKPVDHKDLKPIIIRDYSVTFYGGTDGYQGKCRVIVALYDKTGKTAGWIKFFIDGAAIEDDRIDETGIIHMNLPHGSYQGCIINYKEPKTIANYVI